MNTIFVSIKDKEQIIIAFNKTKDQLYQYIQISLIDEVKLKPIKAKIEFPSHE